MSLTSLESWHAWDSFAVFFENEQDKIKEAIFYHLRNNGMSHESITSLEPRVKMLVESICVMATMRYLRELELKRMELENSILTGQSILKHL